MGYFLGNQPHNKKKKIIISGIRGIPADHGGFETCAERLSLYLEERGWDVSVYCQKKGSKKTHKTKWNNINLINVYVSSNSAFSTILFDLKVVIDSLKFRDHIILTFGYNTAIFNILYRIFNIKNVINMDGIEWKRQKWGFCLKIWFYINEKIAKLFSNVMIADHPEIKKYCILFFVSL